LGRCVNRRRGRIVELEPQRPYSRLLRRIVTGWRFSNNLERDRRSITSSSFVIWSNGIVQMLVPRPNLCTMDVLVFVENQMKNIEIDWLGNMVQFNGTAHTSAATMNASSRPNSRLKAVRCARRKETIMRANIPRTPARTGEIRAWLACGTSHIVIVVFVAAGYWLALSYAFTMVSSPYKGLLSRHSQASRNRLLVWRMLCPCKDMLYSKRHMMIY
jgi:hypothetical protein